MGSGEVSGMAVIAHEPVLVCPRCRATSVDVGRSWSAAGACHLDREVQALVYVPATTNQGAVEGFWALHERIDHALNALEAELPGEAYLALKDAMRVQHPAGGQSHG